MSDTRTDLLKRLTWFPFAIGVLAWIGVVAWLSMPYSARLLGYDSANPNLVGPQGFACPVTADGSVNLRADIPEPADPAIIYQTNFSIIPADVSQGFQPLCAPRAIGPPPYPAQAACHFDVPNLLSRDSGAWFVRMVAIQEAEPGTTLLTGKYGGVCFIRTQAVFTQDLIFASAVFLTGFGLLILGMELLSASPFIGKLVIGLAFPFIVYMASTAVSMALSGIVEWFYFPILVLLVAAYAALRFMLKPSNPRLQSAS